MRSPLTRPGALSVLTKLFEYQKLKTPTSIRLLEITNSVTRKVNCNLQEYDLRDAPPFEALSYTWGNPLTPYSVSSTVQQRLTRRASPLESIRSIRGRTPSSKWSIGRTTIPDLDDSILDYKRAVPINCNSSTLMVTANLFNALSMLSKTPFMTVESSRPRHVWIDAMCISQRDLAERSAQVSMMSSIFQQAEGVVAWLGPEDEFTTDAIKVIQSVGTLPYVTNELSDYTGFFDGEECGLYEKLGIQPLSLKNWLGFIAFINRPWFERAWVVQELAFARTAHLVCGSSVIPWELLARTLQFISDSRWYHHLNATKLRHTTALIQSPGIYRKLLRSDARVGMGPLYLRRTRERHQRAAVRDRLSKGSSLRLLMETHRYTGTTDARDKVYAFLGVADKSQSPFDLGEDIIKPNYNISVQQLYMDTTAAFILSHKTLSVLCNKEDATQTTIKNLPSWVPDYSVPLNPYPLRFRGSPPWRVCRNMSNKWDTRKIDTSLLEAGLLPAQGYKVDTIRSTALISSEASSPPVFWSSIVDLASSMPARYTISYNSGYTPSRFEVLWRTLMTNTYKRVQPAPSSCGTLFVDYILNLQIRHSLAPWSTGSSDLEFRPHQFPVASNSDALPKWHDLLAQEPDDSTFDLALYEQRVKEVITSMFKGTYSPLELAQVQHELDNASGNVRRVFRTEGNLLGTGARSLQKGDELWVLFGSPVPLILRPLANGRYVLVGETYVHGIMHGKVLDMGLDVRDVVIE